MAKNVVTPRPGTAPKVPSEVKQVQAVAPGARSDHQNHVLHMWNTNQWDAYVTGSQKPATPATPAKPPAQTQADVDRQNANRDAATILTNPFAQYGLGSLAGRITGFIQQGYSADAISILLQDTPEYKQRFAANEARLKNGLPVLSPAEYIATERSYRQVMSATGLPLGFYDQTSDFQKFLENDMSPTELKGRVDTAAQAVRQAPKETLDYFKQWYNEGDMIAFALDPTKAEPLVEQRIKAAEAAGVGKTQGVSLDQNTAELIGQQGQSFEQIRQGMGFVGSELPTTNKLSAIYGGEDVTQGDLVKEVFLDDATAAKKRQGLASKERAAFSGSGGAGTGALSSGATGSSF